MASDTVYVGQLICDSTTPPPDRGFYKINDTTTGHVGKLVMSDPVSGKESVALTATLSDGGVGILGPRMATALSKDGDDASPRPPNLSFGGAHMEKRGQWLMQPGQTLVAGAGGTGTGSVTA